MKRFKVLVIAAVTVAVTASAGTIIPKTAMYGDSVENADSAGVMADSIEADTTEYETLNAVTVEASMQHTGAEKSVYIPPSASATPRRAPPTCSRVWTSRR